ncbi:hypothetical protein PG994_006035 [Apiospora phragmitis]|uniref:Uncharacterized protein n=1 Tax=Apiospora phragmitis TaxID=2905665 RepID=A0ABR1VDY1_9PEZI
MARLTTTLVLFSIACTTLVTATPEPFDQEEENRNSNCDKCAPSVLPDSIERQNTECEARNMPFTFDIEAACGIKLSTSSSVLPSSAAAPTTTSDSRSLSASATVTAATNPSGVVPTGSPASNGASPSLTPNSVAMGRAMWNGAVALVVVSGLLLW